MAVSRNIKGITIEIGGNVTELSKALNTIDADLRKTDQNLREINRELKFDPKNTELLGQKQGELAQKIEQTKKRLELLNEAQKDVERQFESGEIGQAEYDAFRREVIKTESQLKGFEDTLKLVNVAIKNSADNTIDWGDKFQKFGGKLEKVGSTLTEKVTKPVGIAAGVVTAAVGKMAVEAAKAYGESDQAAKSFAAATGIAADEIEYFHGQMNDLYAEGYGENFADISAAMQSIKTGTNLANSEIKAATENAMLLNETFDIDISESTRGLNTLMQTFGLTATEAYTLIAQGAQNGVNQNGDLIDTIAEFSSAYSEAGYTAEEMFNTLASGSAGGVFQVNKIGDAINEFSIRMTDGSESTNEALKSLGFSAEEITKQYGAGGESAQTATQKVIQALKSQQDPLTRNQNGVALFGSMWEDMGEKGIFALAEIDGKADKTASTLEEMSEIKFDNLADMMQQIGREMQVELFPVMEDLYPMIRELIKQLMPKIKDMMPKLVDGVSKIIPVAADVLDVVLDIIDGFTKLDPKTQRIIIGFAGAASVAGPVATVLGKVSTGVGNLIEKLKTASAELGDEGSAHGIIGKIGMFGNATGVLAAGGGALALLAAVIALNEMKIQAFNDSITKSGESIATFIGGVGSAKASLSDLKTQTFLNTEAFNTAKANYESAQHDLTTILQGASGEREKITDEEMEALNNYMQRLAEFAAETAKAYEIQSDLLNDQIKSDFSITTTEVQEYMKSAQEIQAQQIDQSTKLKDDALKQAADMYGTETEEYIKQKEIILQEQAERNALYQSQFNKSALLLSSKYREHHSSELQELRDYNEQYLEFEQEKTDLSYDRLIEGDQQLEAEVKKRNEKREKLAEEHIRIWNGENKDVHAAMIGQALIIKAAGGVIDKETEDLLSNYTRQMATMPERSRQPARESMEAMLDAIIAANPEMTTQVGAMKKNLNAIMDTWPRDTELSATEAMKMLMFGIDSNAQPVYDSTGRIITNVKDYISNISDNAEESGAKVGEKAGSGISNSSGKSSGAAEDMIKETQDKVAKLPETSDATGRAVSTKTGAGIAAASTASTNAITKVMTAVKNIVDGQLAMTGRVAGTQSQAISSSMHTGMKPAISNASTVFSGVYSEVSGKLQSTKGLMNFGWSLPRPRLPRFGLSWGSTSMFGKEFRYPTGFNIDWYDKGGIFRSPTIIGVGEKRTEIVGALDDFREIVREETGSSGNTINVYITTQTINEAEMKRICNTINRELGKQLR